MLAPLLIVCLSASALAAPQYQYVQSNINPNNQNVENMFKALDVDSMVKTFDPKFVVVNEQNQEMPLGVHNALVKSLISDLHGANIPVVYAQKRDLPMTN